MLNIVLFGAPGAGKGTQAALLADKHHLVHLSTGDIFRKEMAADTELGKLARERIDRGELVPDEIAIDIIRLQIESYPDAKGFVFDGFPRTVAQAEALDRLMAGKGMQITTMIALDVETEELISRLLKRGKDSGRADDQSLNVIQNRINIYHKKTEPLIKYYHTLEKYTPIKGSGSVEDIFERLHQHVKAIKQ
jgi:adenylate kinase